MLLEPPVYQERLLLMGANGSGKSQLAGALLGSGYPRWVAIDSKGDFPAPQPHVVIRTPDDRRWSWNRDGGILYRPKPEYNTGPWLDEILRRLFLRAQKEGKTAPFVVYVDEALFLSKLGHTRWLSALAVSGRSLKVGLWVSSQRPAWIPVEIRTEAWRWLVFYLAYSEDEKEVLRYAKGQISPAQLQEAAVDYSFWELKRGKGGKVQATHFPALQL